MRLLFLNDRIPPENRGGAGIVMWRLAQTLQQRGHDVHVIAATPGDSFNEQRNGIPTYHLQVSYPARWRAWFSLYNPQVSGALKRLYDRIQPDVINAHNIHSDLTYYSLTLAYRAGIPAVFSSHDVMPFAYQKLAHFVERSQTGDIDPADYRLPRLYNLRQMRFRYNPLRNSIVRYILRRHVQARTTPSHELARAHAANGLPPFETVHNGLTPALFDVPAHTVESLRTRLNLQDRRVILFAGRLTGAKGTRVLLDALLKVVPHVPDVALLVLSSVPIKQQVKQPEYAVLRNNHLVSGGWLSGADLAAAYHLADVVTTPAVYLDPFPTVNLEAMAAKTPVITTCYGGSREAVIDGETGYVINPYHTDTFAQRLRTLLTDSDLRQRMGTAGHQRLIDHFSLEHQADTMLHLFERVSGHRATEKRNQHRER